MKSRLINGELYCLEPDEGVVSTDNIALFLHGFGGSSRHWEKVVTFVPSNIMPLLVDLRGHGLSKGVVPKTIGSYVEDVKLIIDAYKIQCPINIVAHSLSGLIALELCLHNTDMINKMVLISTAPSLLLHPELIDQIRDGIIDKSFIMQSVVNISAKSKRYLLDDFKRIRVICDESEECLQLSTINYLEQLPLIKHETAVIYGNLDKVVSPRRIRLLGRYMPFAHEFMLQNVGHYPHMESAQECATIIENTFNANINK